MGYVYFITDNHNHVKIGASLNPKLRIKELQTGNPFKLELYEVIEADNRSIVFASMFDLEKALHNYFKDYRLEAEWFIFEPIKQYLDWLKVMCESKPKKELSSITNLKCEKYYVDADLFIYGKDRTSKTKKTTLFCEWVK